METTYFHGCCMYWLEAVPGREETMQDHEYQKVEISGDILETNSYTNKNQYKNIKSTIFKQYLLLLS